ncbi:MAG: type IV pili methyl-accepting chemotaxis transducer N-terminal domain-containing protein [Bacteroidota bacterium]
MLRPKFRQLEYLYLIALGCIALAIIISQILIQTSISRQQDDARVINVAGRQRMLSQKITKVALKIKQGTGSYSANYQELEEALYLWKKSHDGLLNGDPTLGLNGNNSPTIIQMFDSIDPNFKAIYKSALSIIKKESGKNISDYLDIILAHETDFLIGMNEIVFQYDREATEKVINLQNTELYLFFGSLLIIVLELFFVFRPLAKNIQTTVTELQESETSSKKMTQALSTLYEELGKSYQDLEAVNITPESASLYASINRQGEFIFLSNKFLNLMEYEEKTKLNSFQQLLEESGYDKDFIDGLFQLFSNDNNWSGELKLINEPGDFVWLETFIVPTLSHGDIKIIAKNVTEFKEAKIRSREINRERIEKSIKEQEYRSSFILEGQEEERKRLSQELHDSIGQMLSALKLQLESIIPSSNLMKFKLENARDLNKTVIQEVRRVSFNLAPSSLDDFGLVAAINKFCEDINRVTKLDVGFFNETKFINRLDPKIEVNLYRIIQEGVNNAIKYSKGSLVKIKFIHSINILNISIEDDGKGFNYNELEKTGHFENPGHGIFNMKERASYIGGHFELDTTLGQGTKVYITLPIDEK